MIVAVVALIVGLGGGFAAGRGGLFKSTGSSGSKISVQGTMSLTGADNWTYVGTSGCTGTSGYDDLESGAEVIISDDSGKTLQITSLSDGAPGPDGCNFQFTASVPAGKSFYGIEVTHRGTIKFTSTEMVAPELTIGS